MNIKEEFSKRFWQAIELNGLQKKNQKQIGAFLGVSAAMVSNYKNALKMPSTDTASEMAIKLNVTFEWLMTGRGGNLFESEVKLKSNKTLSVEELHFETNAELQGQMEPWDSSTPLVNEDYEVPFFMDVELAAGVGFDSASEISGPKLRFSKSTFRKANIQAENAVAVKVSGNSMEPRLFHGDVVGVDLGNKDITDGKTYAINHDGMLRVKRVYRLPGGGIRINSFNADEYPDEIYSKKESLLIIILGVVFWSSSMW